MEKASSLLEATPAVFCGLATASGAARTVCAYLLGTLYLDPAAFLFGGGPWRHKLGLSGLFNLETARTTLTSAEGSLSIAEWLDTYVCDHDPFVADAGVLRHARTPAQAIAQNSCSLLHMVASEDALIPKAMSAEIGTRWGVRATLVEGQGHQMGDEGWEQSVMGPLRAFLDGLT